MVANRCLVVQLGSCCIEVGFHHSAVEVEVPSRRFG